MAVIKKISELTAKGSNIGANDLVIVGVSNGTDYDLKSVTGNQLVGAAVAQTITSGVTTTAPSQDAVKTALDLKVDKVTGSRLITSAEGTKLSNLSGTNTGDQDLSGYQPLLSGIIANSTTGLYIATPTKSYGLVVTSAEVGANIQVVSSSTSSIGLQTSAQGGSSSNIGLGTTVSGAGIVNIGGSFVVSGGASNYGLQIQDGTQGTGKFLKSVNSQGQTNWSSIANTDVSGLGTLSTQSGTFSGTSSGTNTGDQTFLNARVQTVTSSATVTPVSTNDLVIITAQAAGLTLANPTGTFTEGQALMIRIKDNATARSIAFDTNYRAIGVTLPTTTVISKTLYLGIIYNATDSKWDIIGYNIQA